MFALVNRRLLRFPIHTPLVHLRTVVRTRSTGGDFTPENMIEHLRSLNIDGITVTPTEGKTQIEIKIPTRLDGLTSDRVRNLTDIIDGYFSQGGHHININVLNREMLQDAMEHPERYPNLTIRVSGYAVPYSRLTREQQMEVIKRTIHDHK